MYSRFNKLFLYRISGYTKTEARTGLRACANNIDEAISFVLDRRQKLDEARKLGRAERRAKNSLVKTQNSKWVNPRTLHILSEMGFDKDLCALALQKTDNDITRSVRISFISIIPINFCKLLIVISFFQIALLQENQSSLRDELEQTVKPDESLCEQIMNMGFDIDLVRQVLKNSTNDMQKAIENLLKMQADGSYEDALKDALNSVPMDLSALNAFGPAASSTLTPSTSTAIQNLGDEMEVMEYTI